MDGWRIDANIFIYTRKTFRFALMKHGGRSLCYGVVAASLIDD